MDLVKCVFFVGKNDLPKQSSTGDKVLVHALSNMLSELGYSITYIVIGVPPAKDIEYTYKNCINIQVDNIISIPVETSKKIIASLIALIKGSSSGTFTSPLKMTEAFSYIFENQIKNLFSYNIEPLYLMSNYSGPSRKVGFTVDLLEHFYKRRWDSLKRSKLKNRIINGIGFLAEEQNITVFNSSIPNIDYLINHSYVHYLELKTRGVKNIAYFPHPLPVTTYPKKYVKNKNKFNILIIGSFKGVASILGLEFFLREVLPEFEQHALCDDNIEFRFVGHGQMPEDIKNKVDSNKFCNFIGYVEDVQEEWFNADIVLVTIPIEHGFRTRIAEAMNYGKCIIAHIANSKGMPELKHTYNSLLSDQGTEIANYIFQVKNDTSLRRELENNAQNTFLKEISVNVAKLKFKKILESVRIE